MLTACDSSVAVVVPGEGVIVTGGVSNGLRNTNAQLLCGNVEGTVDQKWSWRHLPSMLKARQSPGGAYFNGHVFVAGGNFRGFLDIESLCLPQKGNANPQWTIVSAFHWPVMGPSNLFVFRGEMFFISASFKPLLISQLCKRPLGHS